MPASVIRSPWIVWVVGAAGVAYFLSAVTNEAGGLLVPRNIVFATAAAGIVWMMIHLDPAWLISMGIGAGVFNGNWDRLGGFSSAAVPDRTLIAAGLVALLFRIPQQARDRPPVRARAEYWLIGAAALYVVISAIMAGTFGNDVAFFRLLDRFGLIPFLMFAIAPIAFRTRRQRHILLGSLVVTGAYLALVTWADALKFDALVWPDYIKDRSIGTTFSRGRGPFAAADANGLALLATSIAALIGMFVWRSNWVRFACFGVAGLGLAGTFITLTRSVWVGTGAAIVVTMLSFRQLRPFFLPAVATAYAAVFFMLAGIPGLAERAEERQNAKRPLWDRRNSTAAAVRMLADKPLFGFGWHQYVEKNSDYFVMHPDYPLTGQKYPLHNVYLSNAVELGVLGAALWLAAVMLVLAGAIFRRGPPELLPWRIGLVAIAVQWFAVSALAPFPYSFPNLLLWTWAGVVAGLAPEQRAALAMPARRLAPA
jgi:O-antigen ligase